MFFECKHRFFWAGVLLWMPTTLKAQNAGEKPEQPKAEIPVIADEPKTVDPTTFMPPALAQLATADFADSSISEVVQWLREEHKLVVLLENDALAEIDVLRGDPISDRLDNAPIYLLLNRLQSLGLAWFFEEEVLHITSVKVAQERQTTIPYNIGDLLDFGYDLGALIETIEHSIAPNAWESVGGAGVISSLGDVIFVRQTDSIHREIRGLLSALKKHGRQTFIFDPPQHAKLRQVLNDNVTVTFRDTPLENVVQQLAEKANVDIRLDLEAMQAQGVRVRQPITLTLADRKLKTVLQAILIDLDLTWILRDGVLWITSQEVALSYRKTAVFDVRDLARDEAESDALVEAIESQTEDDWESTGGEGTIQLARPGTMVVYQRESVLREVSQLLETYRVALRNSKPRKRAEEDPNQITTVYYRMHANVAEDLLRMLPGLVQPNSWQNPNRKDVPGSVLMVSSTPEISKIKATGQSEVNRELVSSRAVLIVKQTRAAHQEIREVIRRVESGDSISVGMGGGLGGGGGFGGGFFSIPEKQASGRAR